MPAMVVALTSGLAPLTLALSFLPQHTHTWPLCLCPCCSISYASILLPWLILSWLRSVQTSLTPGKGLA